MSNNSLIRAVASLENPGYQHLTVRLPENEWTALFAKMTECRRRKEAQQLAACVREYKERAAALKPGDSMSFGHYLLPSMVDPNPDYIISPIDWIVLEKDGSRLRLISRDCLFWGAFGGDCWSDSSLRRRLNDECLKEWFTPEERRLIAERLVITPKNPLEQEEASVSSSFDHITLLSVQEAAAYFAPYAPEEIMAHVKPNDELELQSDGAKAVWLDSSIESEENLLVEMEPVDSEWWLRTPGGCCYSAAVVDMRGDRIDLYGHGGDECGVRPVIWIDLRAISAEGSQRF